MKRKISVASAIVLVLIGALIAFQITCRVLNDKYQAKLDQLSEGRQDFSKLFAVEEILKKNYVSSFDSSALGDSSVAGFIAGLGDGRSRYLDKASLSDFTRLSSGSLRGPGFDTVCSPSGEIFISRVIEGTGAEAAGLLEGDRLLEIDSQPVSSLSPTEVRELLWTKSGDSVSVTYRRGDVSASVQVGVSVFSYPSVTFTQIGSVACVRIWLFTAETENELTLAFDAFRSSGVTGVVFDLRSCDWGSFEHVSRVLEKLVSEQAYARTYSSSEDVTTLRAPYGSILPAPAAVIVDSFTSGAAELFAASLRDCAKARVVGETTAGSAAVQTLFRLSDQTAVLLVTRYFAPPVSGAFEGRGVGCDAAVGGFTALLANPDPYNDPPLAISLQFFS